MTKYSIQINNFQYQTNQKKELFAAIRKEFPQAKTLREYLNSLIAETKGINISFRTMVLGEIVNVNFVVLPTTPKKHNNWGEHVQHKRYLQKEANRFQQRFNRLCEDIEYLAVTNSAFMQTTLFKLAKKGVAPFNGQQILIDWRIEQYIVSFALSFHKLSMVKITDTETNEEVSFTKPLSFKAQFAWCNQLQVIKHFIQNFKRGKSHG